MNKKGEVILLHISDLHRTPGGELSNGDLWGSLRNDIRNGYHITNAALEPNAPRLPAMEEVDLVVVSGDLTQRAAAGEYKEAEAFLSTLVKEILHGDRHRMILVPGNHDVDWDLSRAAYYTVDNPKTEHVKEASRLESRYRLGEGSDFPARVLLKRTRDDLYLDRFKTFSQFFRRFYNKAYAFPVDDPKKQFVIFDKFTPSLNVVVVGFNSCDLVDHLWTRGAINREAILRASAELDRRGYPVGGPTRIAVWHHNILGSPEQADFMDPRVAILLAQHGFSLGLHGHVHEAGSLELLGSHAHIPVIWAGSFCAGGAERPPSTPMLYNVIGLDTRLRRGWVHVRARKDEHDAWSAHHEWGEGKLCWYPVEFLRSFGKSGGQGQEFGAYRNIEDPFFLKDLENAIAQSAEITFVSTGLNILTSSIREFIIRRVKEGKLKATICFGNPFSAHVRARLVEEERCQVKPDVAALGIIKRVESLLHQTKNLPGIEVKLFNNYPTMAVLRFDDKYVYYPMGYRMLGNQCPVLWVNRSSLFGGFLEDSMRNYLEDAVDAAEVFRVKVKKEGTLNFINGEGVREVALYGVPNPDSHFYCAGAELLGYDLFTGACPGDDPSADADMGFFREHVGEARSYGFHMTVADVMYVIENQIPSLMCQLREIAASIRAFSLTVDEVADWNNSLILACTEPSGELEKLQSEVTVLIRPSALGTNYTLVPDVARRLSRLDQRDRTMIKTYHSPYVICGFRPHFTVATPPAPPSSQQKERLNGVVAAKFQRYLQAKEQVEISRLYFLTRAVGAKVWDTPTEENTITLKT